MKFIKYTLIALVAGITTSSSAQTEVLQSHIEKAWLKNEALKAKTFDLNAAEWNHKEAKAMFGPTVGFNLGYTLATGGRNISFPVGDLLNPVYNTLNNLTGTQQFSNLQNQEINFFPNNFYDAKVVINQPIYYPDLALNQKLKVLESEAKSLEVRAFKRQLSKEVMSAAFQVESSRALQKIYQEAGVLMSEAKRATQSMVKNEVAPVYSLRRIDAQMAQIEGQSLEASALKNNAQNYFQFLTGDTLGNQALNTLEELPLGGITSQRLREELLQLQTATSMMALASDKENNFYKPRLGAQLSLGSQAFNFGWQPYVLMGINLDINLFDNKRHSFRKDAAKARTEVQQAQYRHTLDLINLQITNAENNLFAAIDQAQKFAPRVSAAQQFYKDSYTRYKEGNASYLELVDAQTQLTQTQIQYQLSRYNAWIKWSDWVYASAFLNIP
jgi:outer membrane protein TolC